MNTSSLNGGQDQECKDSRDQVASTARPVRRNNAFVEWVVLVTNRKHDVEDYIDSYVLKSRWVLFMCYIMLGLSLFPIILLAVIDVSRMFTKLMNTSLMRGQNDYSEVENLEREFMHITLDVVDLTLIANLVVMVVYFSYVAYISRTSLGSEESGYLPWLSALKNGSLEGVHRIKILFLTSLVTISAVHLLELALEVEPKMEKERLLLQLEEIGLCIIVLFSLVICGLVVAKINQLDSQSREGVEAAGVEGESRAAGGQRCGRPRTALWLETLVAAQSVAGPQAAAAGQRDKVPARRGGRPRRIRQRSEGAAKGDA